MSVDVIIIVSLIFFGLLLLVIGFFAYIYLSTLNVKVRSKKAIKNIDEKSQYRKSPPPRRPHNELYAKVKDKKMEEKAASAEKAYTLGLRKYDEQGIALEGVGEEVEIVGLAEPVGFWSRLIMGQKVKFIAARMNLMKQNKKVGAWQVFIQAQSMSQGKSQGRGR